MNREPSHGRRAALALTGVALVTLAVTPPAARAATQTFNTAAATENGGDPVNATATFVESDNTLTITVTNLFTGPKNVDQALSGLSFTISGGSLSGSSMASDTSGSSGQEVTIPNNGHFTLGSTVATGWAYSSTDPTGTLNFGGSNHLIVGPPDGNKYKGSITGNNNPFLNGSATFTITGLTGSPTVTAATFSFGTVAGDNVAGVDPPLITTAVPEPSALAIAGLGALGFVGYGFRRRMKQ
jgi:hypothetical protein